MSTLRKKILLLNPPNRNTGIFKLTGIYAPLGLCYIASYIRERGYEVSILDSEGEQIDIENTLKRIEAYKPDILGISCKSYWIQDTYKLVKLIKEKLPQTILVAGGNHISSLPRESLQMFPEFDYLVIGEGEITFFELLEAFNNKIDIPNVAGIAYVSDGKVTFNPPRERIKNLDVIPLPAYDLLPELRKHYIPVFNYSPGYPAFSIVLSRGCPAKCRFCTQITFGHRVTQHSAEYLFRHIEELYFKYKIKNIIFDDDNLLLNKKQLYAFFKMLREKKMKISFSLQTRVNFIDDERLSQLKEAGCKKIMLGIESGSQEMLDNMRKDITLDQIRHAVKLIKKYKIHTLGFFLIGFPGETIESMKQTAEFIKELKLFDALVSFYTPLPGADVYNNISDYGDFDREWNMRDELNETPFIPNGLTKDLILEYFDKWNDACYSRMYQIPTIPARLKSIPFQHIKTLIRYFLFKR